MHRWTDRGRDRLRTLVAEGLTARVIAQRLGLGVGQVTSQCKTLHIHPAHAGRNGNGDLVRRLRQHAQAEYGFHSPIECGRCEQRRSQ